MRCVGGGGFNTPCPTLKLCGEPEFVWTPLHPWCGGNGGEIPDASISVFRHVDSSPQSRGEEMIAISFEIWDQRLPWSRELMPVLSLERHMLDARSKTLAFAGSNLPLGGAVGRGHDSFLILSSLHLDGHGYRTLDGEHGGLPLLPSPRALPTHGCTRTRATASHAHLRSLFAESRLDASMGCDSQAGIQLIVVVPVLVRWHACCQS